jgi:excisionase family DNA binding protein
MTKWLTVDEIAHHLRTTPSTVYKLKERGLIRGYRAGRRLIFDVDEVDADIKRRQKKKPAARVRRAPNGHHRKVS